MFHINILNIAEINCFAFPLPNISGYNSEVAADVDGDGYITSLDFGFVRQFILKFIVIFPVEEAAINSSTWGDL